MVSLDCITAKTGNICEHIKAFYDEIAGSPFIFWQFEEDILTEGYSIEQSTSTTGDECHHDIKNVTTRKAGNIIKKIPPEDFSYCDGTQIEQFNEGILSTQ